MTEGGGDRGRRGQGEGDGGRRGQMDRGTGRRITFFIWDDAPSVFRNQQLHQFAIGSSGTNNISYDGE